MKTELIRKVIPDFYWYNGERRENYRLIFEYYDENEQYQCERLRFKTEKEANKKLKEFERRETKNKGRFVSDKNQLRFADFAEKYKTRMLARLSPTSHEGETIRVDAAIAHFGNRTIASIRRPQIDEYIEFLKEQNPNRSQTTINRYLQRLRAVLNDACIYDDSLPMPNFKGGLISSAKEKKRKRTISYVEFDRILNACIGRQEYLRIYYLALWELGCREGELQGIKGRLDGVRRRDVDLEAQTVWINNSKIHPNKLASRRLCYLSEYLRDALIDAGIENLEPDAFVFPSGDFKKSWAIIKERAGIDETPNPKDDNSGAFWEKDLRHCFASNCGDAEVQDSVISHQLGHTGDDLLNKIYKQQRAEFLRKKFERFELHSKEQRALGEAAKHKQTAPGSWRFEYEIERFERAA